MKVRQTGSELATTVVTKLYCHETLLFAERLEVRGGKLNIHSDILL